jgi:hypothetical protein
MVSTCQGIGQRQRRYKILGEKKSVCHKKAVPVYLR